MSIEIEKDPTGRFVTLRVHGVMTPDLAIRSQAEIARTYPGINRLWDLRDAEFSNWTADDMRTVDHAAAVQRSTPRKLRVAGLVSRDLDFGLSRMFETLASSNPRIDYRTFRDPAEAERWLEE